MKLNEKLLNALDTVFCDEPLPLSDTLKYTEFLRCEAFTFQWAIRLEPEETDKIWENGMELRAVVESPISDKIEVYIAENVPAMKVGYRSSDDWFLRKTPGLYPDRLTKVKNLNFTAPRGLARSIYFTINEELCDIPSGEYPIKLKLYKRYRGEVDAVETFTELVTREITVKVIDACLPKQKIIATNWIHYDCISHFSGLEPFSEEYFEVVKKIVRLAVKNGQNMIYVPAFTPPLDTPVGEERMTVQLVDITLENGEYTFDFSKLERFILICLDAGAEYLEHNHLFTQWGAKNAPKIIVRENGEEKKLFGWHTDASSEEYVHFLRSYITSLRKFLSENDYEKHFFFHVSDEPDKSNIESYSKSSAIANELLLGLPCGDALSDYAFYEDGIVKTPIVATDHIDCFLGKADHLWVYFIGMQSNDNLPNRLIGMPEARGRVLGAELYYHNIDGFLHWGFNAWHNRLSRKIIDPRISSDMGADFVGGTSYLVYPSDDGAAEPSTRLISFRDAMQDARALLLLENLVGREEVISVLKKHIPDISFKCRISGETLTDLRREVNSMIEKFV